MFLLAIDTGEKRRLTSPPSPAIGDSCPSLSPDGRTLAFSRTVDVSADLYLLAISDALQPLGEAKRITLGNLSGYSPAWTEDGREIVFGTLRHQPWGCGELTSPCLKADPPNRSHSRLLGKTPPLQLFRAGGTASLTHTCFPIPVFGAWPHRVDPVPMMK